VRVWLLEASNPCLVLVAVKTSQGRAWRKLGRYWPECDQEKLRRWVLDAVGYPSVYEHLKLTWFVEGISRVASHQLVRHRIASYTQESQRYTEDRLALCLECLTEVLANSGLVEVPDADCSAWSLWELVLEKLTRLTPGQRETVRGAVEGCLETAFVVRGDHDWVATILHSLLSYVRLRGKGYSMEDARYVLPQTVKTSVLVTMNLREFLHFYCLRTSWRAQDEIRELAEEMMEEAAKAYPWLPDVTPLYCQRHGYFPGPRRHG